MAFNFQERALNEPLPAKAFSGCRFHPRCPEAREVCRQDEPVLKEVMKGHLLACHFATYTRHTDFLQHAQVNRCRNYFNIRSGTSFIIRRPCCFWRYKQKDENLFSV
ncbi:oligopeptide/dipeptide ABC transporter, ATP-binding protein, C-terminal domain-containing protein [Desulfofundulus thermosubterraneus DSM 16057]|uniref:Oligopeptide/dipeptide ABC transporter, ATP-binding protein, C-terminal domain-containing protein n=1 Tax=Desulfofundulus thermosubterraneus DSM 16057 TaxID=1121432 RepID=A0A1M6JUK9_9FIRM|nr:oligopeptide/dipeptide ABC transporter, ATP-binding protein, C-terminal domain-containing protein [Desulfofundulus thermosubterraneus DSM 16057]